MIGLFQDLRYPIRQLRLAPAAKVDPMIALRYE